MLISKNAVPYEKIVEKCRKYFVFKIFGRLRLELGWDVRDGGEQRGGVPVLCVHLLRVLVAGLGVRGLGPGGWPGLAAPQPLGGG